MKGAEMITVIPGATMQEPKKYTAREAMHWMIDHPEKEVIDAETGYRFRFNHCCFLVRRDDFLDWRTVQTHGINGNLYVREEYDAWQDAWRSLEQASGGEMSEKTFKIVNGDISDGYHTFEELYEHRYALFVALCSMFPTEVKWRHEPSFGDWICVYLELGEGQISYHLPSRYLCCFDPTQGLPEGVNPWDGHNSQQVIDRLLRFAGNQLEAAKDFAE